MPRLRTAAQIARRLGIGESSARYWLGVNCQSRGFARHGAYRALKYGPEAEQALRASIARGRMLHERDLAAPATTASREIEYGVRREEWRAWGCQVRTTEHSGKEPRA